jgi:hypothetical protein
MLWINSFIPVSDVHDGTSHTLLVGESVHPARFGLGPGYGNVGGPCPWYEGSSVDSATKKAESVGRQLRPAKYPLNSVRPMADDVENDVPFGSPHVGGAFFAFADGHVDFLADEIDFATYQALSTRSGREISNAP